MWRHGGFFVFLTRHFTFAAWWTLITLCAWLMSHMHDVWQVYECDSCALLRVIIEIKTSTGHFSLFCWQNFVQVLRYCLRWTYTICEEIGKRFCSSKPNFPWLKRVYLPCISCTFIHKRRHINHLGITWLCSVALYPFIQMLFTAAALPFLR